MLGDTPASTNGIASAVTHVVHAFATLAQGATAAVKFWDAVTGQDALDGGGEYATGGGIEGGGCALGGG